ncbi:MAG: 30S ribosomal protein S4 [Calditrichaeota bacterium]|jgi:small subunit ribosomal protein S4|nr:30S ribosomal protein S4 [Calditrichota bacterium]MBT7787331.1 30S ribosomal protein S4 [Calditrichota bacterium]
MARYTGSVCKLCRREGEKLFLKGERCFAAKCSFDRRNYAPGQHGQNRRFKQSNYGLQLREKQKIRRTYGLLEKQFRNNYEKAEREKGVTGERMLMRLESRLDVCVYRLGLAPSLKGARQFVSHGHVTVNTRKVDIPSYMLRPGDKIQIRAQSRKMDIIHNSMQRVRENRMVPYLSLDKAKMEGEFLSLPKRDEIPITAREQLVVELYSR